MTRPDRATAVAALAILLAVFPVACGDDEGAAPAVRVGDLTVTKVFAGSYGATTAAAYLQISNDGEADRLTGVSSPDAGSVEPMGAMSAGSTTAVDGSGPVDVEIPAGGSVSFTPGGAHLMLEDLRAPLDAGDTLRLRLTFEHAPPVELAARVVDVAEIPDLMAAE